MLYEVFWVLIVRLVFPRIRTVTAALGVCLITCTLEVFQLWKPPWLQTIRATFLGGVLLGTTFDQNDFVYYVLGSFLGYLVLSRLVGLASRYEA